MVAWPHYSWLLSHLFTMYVRFSPDEGVIVPWYHAAPEAGDKCVLLGRHHRHPEALLQQTTNWGHWGIKFTVRRLDDVQSYAAEAASTLVASIRELGFYIGLWLREPEPLLVVATQTPAPALATGRIVLHPLPSVAILKQVEKNVSFILQIPTFSLAQLFFWSKKKKYCQAPRSTYNNINNLTWGADSMISGATTTHPEFMTMKECTIWLPTTNLLLTYYWNAADLLWLATTYYTQT